MSDTTYKSANKLAGQAKDMARDIRDKAANLKDDVSRAAKDQATQFADTAKHVAGEAMSQAQGQIESAVSEQKSAGANYIGSIAQAAERAAGEFDQSLPIAADYIRQASEQIQGVADTVRDKDLRELLGEVENFARKQPALFFGGALILGFAALRFLKSSAPSSPSASVGSYSPDRSYADYGAFEQRRSGQG
jgi:hypothetical protein